MTNEREGGVVCINFMGDICIRAKKILVKLQYLLVHRSDIVYLLEEKKSNK